MCVKKSNIEGEKVNLRSKLDFLLEKFPIAVHFYWGNSPVNFKGQTPGGKVSLLSPVVDTPMPEGNA